MYTNIQGAFIIFILLIDITWIKFSDFVLIYDKKTLFHESLFFLFLFSVWGFYKIFRPDPRVVSFLETVFFTLFYSYIILIFSYLVATLNQPLVDSSLIAVDHFFGIRVSEIDFWFRDHVWWDWIFTGIYNCYLYQAVFIIVCFSYLGKVFELQRFLMQFMIAILITIIISAFFPALGPYEWDHYAPREVLGVALQHMVELRQNIMNMDKITGIVTFPSFHAVMALLYAYLFRNERKVILIPILVLNALIIFSCIPIGEHYFVDILAAFPVFLLAIGLEYLIYKKVAYSQKKEAVILNSLN